MKCNIFFYLTVFCLTFLYKSSTDFRAEQLSHEWKEYYSPRLSIRFSVPTNWTFHEEGSLDQASFLTFLLPVSKRDSIEGKNRALIQFVFSGEDYKNTLSHYKSFHLNNKRKRFPDILVLPDRNEKDWKGFEFFNHIQYEKSKKEGFLGTASLSTYILDKNKNFYSLSLSESFYKKSPTDSWQDKKPSDLQYTKIYERILSSIKVVSLKAEKKTNANSSTSKPVSK